MIAIVVHFVDRSVRLLYICIVIVGEKKKTKMESSTTARFPLENVGTPFLRNVSRT